MIGEAVSLALQDAAFAADWVRDGATAIDAASDQHYDAILLDLGLPERDGLDVLRAIRGKGNALSILIMTARDAVQDRIAGLDGGADNYVIKSFEMAVRDIVQRMFAPLRALAGKVDARADEDLSAINETGLPVEILPLVRATNRLLARVGEAMTAQRRFVADAAHELRTPLSALTLQAERIGTTDLPVAARERVAFLRSGLERAHTTRAIAGACKDAGGCR